MRVVLLIGVANVATLLGARAVLDRIRTGRPAPDAVLFLTIRLFLISAAVVLAGLTRTLGPLGLGLAECCRAVATALGSDEKRLTALRGDFPRLQDLIWQLGECAAWSATGGLRIRVTYEMEDD